MNTCSFSFPNIFDVAKNTVATNSDKDSILSRVKLLLLTEPTELYGEPDFGVGLKKFLFRYNTDNIIPEIRDRIVDQLEKWEPTVNAQLTKLQRSETTSSRVEPDHLKLTLIIYTIYGDELSLDLPFGSE